MQHQEIRKLVASRLAGFRQVELPVTLYQHQEETLDKVRSWLENPQGTRRGYISQATGLGKTILFATLLRFCAGLRTLVIVSTKTLVDQTVRKLVGFTNGSMAHMSSLPNIHDDDENIIAKRWKDQAYDVLVATDDSFKTKRALERIIAFAPQVIIWDECHWGYTEKAQNALAMFPEAVVLAFSATPDFLTNVCKNDYAPVTLDNGQVLYGTPDRFARTYFGDLIDERSVRWGIEHGHLAPLAWGRLEFSLSLDGIPTVQGPAGLDYDQSALSKMLAKNWPFVAETICKLYQSGQYGLAKRFSAAICPGVKQAYELVEALQGIGVSAECITGSTPDVERRRIFKAGEKGDVAFLASVFALREGWDAPNAEVAMMLRPTKSRVLYLQFMGRPLRKYGDKVALVLDPHYQNARFAPLSAPVLFGKPGQEVYDGGILVGPKNGKARKVAPSWLTKEKLAQLKPTLVVEKIEVEYWAGPDGFFEADGERWGTIFATAALFDLAHKAVAARISSFPSRFGRTRAGNGEPFYALSDAEKACADLLQDIPVADSEGFFNADGERWGSVNGLARKLGLGHSTVTVRVGSSRRRIGKTKAKSLIKFYALSDAEKACADLLQDIPVADSEGFFNADGERWGSVSALADFLGLSDTTVKKFLVSCRSRKGKDRVNHTITSYALSDVLKAGANLFENLPQAGSNGTFLKDGEVWGTQAVFARKLGFDPRTAAPILQKCRMQYGRGREGRPRKHYALSDVKKAHADLLKKKRRQARKIGRKAKKRGTRKK